MASRRLNGGSIALIALGIATLLVLATPLWAPVLGRQVDWFDVRRVEVSGASLLPANEILRLSGIRRDQSVLENPAAWEAALEQHPAILSAEVRLKLPRTLRIEVVEERPVALVGEESLALATAAGDVLPVSPAGKSLDLPIVFTPLEGEKDVGVRRALAEVGRLADLDPPLIRRVSEVRASSSGDAVVLSHALGEIVLPIDTDAERLAQLRAVLIDLERTEKEEKAGRRPVIDVRYEGQVVVRYSNSSEIS